MVLKQNNVQLKGPLIILIDNWIVFPLLKTHEKNLNFLNKSKCLICFECMNVKIVYYCKVEFSFYHYQTCFITKLVSARQIFMLFERAFFIAFGIQYVIIILVVSMPNFI